MIIDEFTFAQVQKIRGVRSHVHPRQATSKFIFSGLLSCRRCGAPLIGKSTHKGKYYHYYRFSSKHLGKLCDLPNLDQRLIEKRVSRTHTIHAELPIPL
ncbi:zinc ribbon domain-containing protein [Effusibacillus consociatus]|uniref:Zinc ribbon domain-containing protein n=1 Tax=Effusibacillus consociatus TaxID=1117041 RepID=A0ABV9Q5Y7_9BACL